MYKCKPQYVQVAYKWQLVVYKALKKKRKLYQKARLLVTLDFSNLVL